jgi:hypothetical protein
MTDWKKWKKHIEAQGLHACHKVLGEARPFRVVFKCYENENHELWMARSVAGTVTSKCLVNFCPWCGFKALNNTE